MPTDAEAFDELHFDATPALLCYANAAGYFTKVNAFWQETLGWERHELLAKPFLDFVHEDDRDGTVAAMSALERGEAVHDFENRYLAKDGSYHWLSWNSVRRGDRIFAAARDVTKEHALLGDLRIREEQYHKAKLAAERHSRAKSEFLARMSHELRTPLNAIIGFSDMLANGLVGPLNEKQLRYAGNIRDSGRHLLDLINDILDIAKIEAGRLALHREHVAIPDLLAEAEALVVDLAARKRLDLRVECAQGLPALSADRRRVKQALLNLVGNAIKFTPEGGSVQVRAELAAPGRIRIAVEDSGIGISADDLERIFREFEQVDGTYARSGEGTGLGLSLTRQLIELHGGSVQATSEGLGKGSRFVIELPVAESAGSAEPVAATGAGPLVLVAETDGPSQELLEQYLRHAGYRVARVPGTASLRDEAVRLRPAAITLDIGFPGMADWRLLAELTADPDTRGIPVVLTSVREEDVHALEMGAVAFLVKPFDRRLLEAAMERALGRPVRRQGRVLVVDDQPETAEPLLHALKDLGWRVDITDSGWSALEAVRRSRPDLMVLDLLMPGCSGYEVLAELRAQAATANLPVLIYTVAEAELLDRERLASAQHILSKASQGQELKAVLERVVPREAPSR